MNEIGAKFVGNELVVTMPLDEYEEVESLLQERYGISLETAIRQFVMWSVTSRHEFRKWIREASEHTAFLEEKRR